MRGASTAAANELFAQRGACAMGPNSSITRSNSFRMSVTGKGHFSEINLAQQSRIGRRKEIERTRNALA